MNLPSSENESSPSQHDRDPALFQDLVAKKNWVDTLAWYLLVMGFISILVGGLFFWLYGQGKLSYQDYTLNGIAVGRYFLFGGIGLYLVGRVLTHTQRIRRRRESHK